MPKAWIKINSTAQRVSYSTLLSGFVIVKHGPLMLACMSKLHVINLIQSDTLQKAITCLQDSDAAGVAYQKMLSSFAAEHDISSQEACHILFELSLVKSSHQYRKPYVAPDEASESVNFESS